LRRLRCHPGKVTAVFFEMSTRTSRNAYGPVDCKCKKCGADVAVVCDRSDERKLYWVVSLGTSHTVTLVCTGCQRERSVRGASAGRLVQKAIENAEALAAYEAREEAARLQPELAKGRARRRVLGSVASIGRFFGS
jgi:hypothetical protein